MERLKKTFKNRNELIGYVKALAPFSLNEASPLIGGQKEALKKLKTIDPVNYGKTRNFGRGKITQLSPYLNHGIIDLNDIRNEVIKVFFDLKREQIKGNLGEGNSKPTFPSKKNNSNNDKNLSFELRSKEIERNLAQGDDIFFEGNRKGAIFEKKISSDRDKFPEDHEPKTHVKKLQDKPLIDKEKITGFIQQLCWRDFWQRVAKKHKDWIWSDIEPYKTGFKKEEYSDKLPIDIENGSTGVSCIDTFIKDLIEIGYIHNHARLYLASYVIHFRHIKWQTGAKWFLEHLLDGDEASNNFSWQWVASTFSQKPYIFNLENVDKYFGDFVDTKKENNKILDASYEELEKRLFPYLGKNNE
jgi:deoxyribodipyrimidine photolyase